MQPAKLIFNLITSALNPPLVSPLPCLCSASESIYTIRTLQPQDNSKFEIKIFVAVKALIKKKEKK